MVVALPLYQEEAVERPRTRGDCFRVPRPCPFVSCRHHLYLEVLPRTGRLQLAFPNREPWELEESCSLDVADRGDATLERVGEAIGVTRERVRQLEHQALGRLARVAERLQLERP